MTDSRQKILIINSYGRADKGDAVLLASLLDQLKKVVPNPVVYIGGTEDPALFPTFQGCENVYSPRQYTAAPEKRNLQVTVKNILTKVYTYNVVYLSTRFRIFEPLLPQKLRRYVEVFKSVDAVVSVGGGYINAKDPLLSASHLFFLSQPFKLGHKLGKLVIVAPVSVGPFMKKYQENIILRAFKNVDLLLIREDISYDLVKKDKELHPIRTVDSGFAYNPSGSYSLRRQLKIDRNEKIVAITVRKCSNAAIRKKYEAAIGEFLVWLTKTHADYTAVFVPQCTAKLHGDDDRQIAKDICLNLLKNTKAKIIMQDLDYQKVKLAYRDVDYVIGTRFHSVIFALPYGVPAIGIEYEYKTRGIMTELGLEKWIIKIEDMSGKDLIHMFETLIKQRKQYLETLNKVLPPYIQQTDETVALMQKVWKTRDAELLT